MARREADRQLDALMADVDDLRRVVENSLLDDARLGSSITRIETDVTRLREALDAHISEEHDLINELGSSDAIRARVVFVNMLIDREATREKFKRAIIEKTLLGAIWTAVVFVVVALWHEVGAVLLDLLRRRP